MPDQRPLFGPHAPRCLLCFRKLDAKLGDVGENFCRHCADEGMEAVKAINRATRRANPERFDGATYDPWLDGARLGDQMRRVFDVMKDGEWRTLEQIATDVLVNNRFCVTDSEAAISARLRDFRKPRFGAHYVDRERVAGSGLWRYRLRRRKKD